MKTKTQPHQQASQIEVLQEISILADSSEIWEIRKSRKSGNLEINWNVNFRGGGDSSFLKHFTECERKRRKQEKAFIFIYWTPATQGVESNSRSVVLSFSDFFKFFNFQHFWCHSPQLNRKSVRFLHLKPVLFLGEAVRTYEAFRSTAAFWMSMLNSNCAWDLHLASSRIGRTQYWCFCNITAIGPLLPVYVLSIYQSIHILYICIIYRRVL